MRAAQRDHYVELDTDEPGPAGARTRDKWIHVWALIGYLQGNNWDMQQAAVDYGIPVEAVQAAVDYYRQHRAEIDARLVRNRMPVG